MTSTKVPTRAELVGRATNLVGLIRRHARWQEEHRIMHEEVLQGILDTDLLKMTVPRRYGGFESDVRTVCEVLAELGRGDGSVAWTVTTLTLASWQVGMFSDEVQDEIFADPDVRICGAPNPTGVAVATEGGVILNGEWNFNTGAPQSQWGVHPVLLATGDGDDAAPVPAAVAVAMKDLTIVDDWSVAGLRATSSVTVLALDVFVPEARVLPFLPGKPHGQHRSQQNADSPTWRAPIVPWTATVVSSSALGMAQAAREFFFERLPDQKIAYTDYERQIDAPLTHLQVAQAALKIDEAEYHLHRAADRLDFKAVIGEPWTAAEWARTRMDAAASCERAKEAVDILATASGSSSVYTDVPIQRIKRDIQTLNSNGVVHPNSNAEAYGQVLCGLEPDTFLM